MKTKNQQQLMTHTEHRERHVMLHRHLDELIADWVGNTKKLPSTSTVFELMKWSYQQTITSTER